MIWIVALAALGAALLAIAWVISTERMVFRVRDAMLEMARADDERIVSLQSVVSKQQRRIVELEGRRS